MIKKILRMFSTKPSPDRPTGAPRPITTADNSDTEQREWERGMFHWWLNETFKEQRRSRRWKVFFRFGFLSLLALSLGHTIYIFNFAGGPEEKTAPHLAVVDVKGVIDANEEASASRINAGLRAAYEGINVEAVVLRINSPGGSPVQSQAVYEEIRHLSQEHPDIPVYSWVEDIGASGAYYIAAATNEIYAAPASLVGSIGVISSGFGFSEAMDRVGVERRTFTSGENKAFLDPFSKVSDQQRAFWESVLGSTHEQFIEAVRNGRGDRLIENDMTFSGLVWTGEQAVELGLIDGVMTLEQLSRELVGDVEMENYTPRLSALERLTGKLGPRVASTLGIDLSTGIRYQLPGF